MIFLDLDGTLTDPAPGILGAVVHALTGLGLPVPPERDLTWVIGPPLLDSFATLGAPDPHQALEIYRARYGETGLFECKVYDGIPAVLQTLRSAGHRLCLMTAKPHVYATRITAHFGLDVHLAHQFGPELDGTRNDKAELLAHALSVCKTPAHEAIMIGDRHHDIDAALANGMRSIAVRWGYGTQDEHVSADAICDHPADIPAAVAKLSNPGGHAQSAETRTTAS